eukprot:Em0015g814a
MTMLPSRLSAKARVKLTSSNGRCRKKLTPKPTIKQTEQQTRAIEPRRRWLGKRTPTSMVSARAFSSSLCGFGGLRNIQSSINSNAGLGVVTLSILYALFMVSSLYTPGLINAFGTKYVYLAGVSGYFLYTAANYYSTWYTLIPACVIAGLASGPVWAASRVHIIQVAIEMAPFLKKAETTVISQFVGIVYLAFQLSSVPGNLASSLILYLTDKDAYGNSTLNTTNASLCTAGTRKIEQKYIYMLISVYMAFMTASLVIAALTVDNTRRAQKQSWKAKIKTVFDVEVFKMLFTWKMALIFPMGMYAGMELSYFTGTFAKDYISNCLGVSQVGFVLIVFGAASAIMSGFIGRLIKYVPHFVFIIVAGLVSAGLLVFLLLWNPVPSYAMVYSFALIWGLTDSVWDTLSSARTRTLEQIFLYQVYCPTKAVAKGESEATVSDIAERACWRHAFPLDASHRPDLMVQPFGDSG